MCKFKKPEIPANITADERISYVQRFIFSRPQRQTGEERERQAQLLILG